MSVLSPHDPISDPNYLFGRRRELVSLRRYVERGGAQPLITGYRGIGKTSLVNCYLGGTSARVLSARCGHLSTFGSISRDLLEQVDEVAINATRRSTFETNAEVQAGLPIFKGGGGARATEEETRKPIHTDSFRYGDLLRELKRSRQADTATLIVIEEIDTLRDEECINSLVEFVKACSDDWLKSRITVLCVGIQAAVTKFILKHKSLNRCAREIYLEPIAAGDLRQIISNAEKELKFSFPDAIADDIAQNAGGFPYYVHMMADYCVQELELEEWRVREVSLAHYERAKRAARHEAYQAMRAEVVTLLDDPKTVEAHLLHFLSIQRENYVPVEKVLTSVTRTSGAKRAKVREILWSLVKSHEILYFHGDMKAVSFIGPALRPFIASQFRPALVSLQLSGQQRLPLE